ncbi:terminase gpA endonuclease subunit [Alitiscatomonas aceti]|uniref:Phage terminase large subunit family protein n=1 Tax=Alitiscatomonas aceti TaxID=2981724 RepID=A0ABT2UY68_9FIRM|nr:terminase gpA endonuclease subunit [Alitiscatomonas aceti]MCU6799507.1 phage terminase large subunit family protein [Alitiscatomonas aceti]
MTQRSRNRKKTGQLFRRTIKKALAIQDEITVSQWAERYRVLDESSNLSGKWSNAVTPYLVGIMDAFNDPRIREIYLCKGSQLGGTEALINMLGYIICEEPGPALIVYPSDDLAKDVSNDKLKPAFRLVPEIRKQFSETRSKELRLKFKSMNINITGAGSPSKLASRAIRYLFFDEIDKMGGASKKEASPYSLAMERIKTFKTQSKVYACSTPTLKTNYIWQLHDSADEVREYFVPCPHCEAMIRLEFKHILYDKDPEKDMSPYERAQTSSYVCPECGCEILDRDKPRMLRKGEWRAVKKRGVGNPKTVGFRLNSLYSVFVTWADVAEEFLKSKDDPEMLQNFANSWLAEPWEDTKLKTTEDLVKERQTEYEESEVPDWAVELTGGIDVQETSVYWVIRAWGEHWTSQLVARGQAVNLWEVDGIMNLNYQKRDGTQMAPSLVLVDSGDQTDMVYDFCVDTAEYTLPSKGASKKLETDYKISTINKAGSRATGHPLVMVDTSKYKDRIAARMARKNGNGAWMVFRGIDDEYAAQVTAEHKINERQANGKIVQKWVPKGSHKDNHYLDAEVYAMAAADIRGARTWHLDKYEPSEAPKKSRSGSEAKEEQWIRENELEGWI